MNNPTLSCSTHMDHVSGSCCKAEGSIPFTVTYPGWKRREDSEVEGKSAGKGSCDNTENKNKNV
jgi:hypothetical protein